MAAQREVPERILPLQGAVLVFFSASLLALSLPKGFALAIPLLSVPLSSGENRTVDNDT